MSFPRILGIATAVPQYGVEQQAVKQFAAGLFEEKFHGLDRMLSIFEHGNIKNRHFACPLEWYSQQHTFNEANGQFEKIALELTHAAAAKAIEKAGILAAEIGGVVFVTSTGITTPTLDAKLIQRLGLSLHALRLPVWGLGCAGGVTGMARAADLAKAVPGRFILLVAVELCSITFQRNDFSKSNLVGTSIFADGAAAVVIGTGVSGPEIIASHSTLFPDTEDIMGWDVVDSGLKVRFSRDIPGIIRRYLPSLLAEACDEWGIEQKQLRHYVVHPGGAKVLTAYSESLGLIPGKLSVAQEILENYGNMSSASVFFVLEEHINNTCATNDYGVMLALGPGFSAEQVLFKW